MGDSVNQFLTSPVKVVIYDPIKNQSEHIYCFLGDVTRAVVDACNNYATANATVRSGYDRILKEQYGSDYKTKLCIGIKNYQTACLTTIATGEFAGGDDMIAPIEPSDEWDDIEELLAKDTKSPAQVVRRITLTSSEDLQVSFTPGCTYITNVHIFPEDNWLDLKEKIYLVTNIPYYRQHLYYVNNNRHRTTYQLAAEGFYKVDIRTLPYYTNLVQGCHVDKKLYDLRNNIRVEALDTFRILGNELGVNTTNTVYITDLAKFTQPVISQLREILKDTYQLEMLYYGFIIKFWPQLTKDCFYDFIISEPDLQHKYPELAKSKTVLSGIYKAEKDIITQDYQRYVKIASQIRPSIAITQMTASIPSGNVMLNIRNLFDKLRVSRCVPEIHAYIERGGRRYMLKKRHIMNNSDVQFPSGNLMKTGIVIAISLRKVDQESFHAKQTATTFANEQSRYLFLNITVGGRYHVRSVWNEEDELGFEDIIRVMKKFTDPLITLINKMGRYVFVSGSALQLITKQNITYQGLNISVFWKKVVTEATFKAVRSCLDQYMRARCTTPRNVQQFDKYEFTFRKGMHEFTASTIDRIISASNNMVLANNYAYLSNNTVKQKWDQHYEGRIVKMAHRTTDVSFEVSDIREAEFSIFYRYITAFIYRAINSENVKLAISSIKSYTNVKKLRKLKEQDPELYNLKKYGSDKVYSTICQNKKQPLIYTADEMKNMSVGEIKRLTQYWNFTMQKPAFYGCPNKKYPHLSFMVNAHPKHYCLPCCNKKPLTDEGNKKTHMKAICLAKHKFTGYELTDGISRHVMNYGKDIDIGRLAKLPVMVKNLLYDTLEEDDKQYNTELPHRPSWYIYGVAQHLPGVQHVGILFSIAEVLTLSPATIITTIIGFLKKHPTVIKMLLNGVLLEYFKSNEELCEIMTDLFLNMKLFAGKLVKFNLWSELFMELFHIVFKISIFTFIDDSSLSDNLQPTQNVQNTPIDLFVSATLKNEILYLNKIAISSDQKYAILIKRENKYYPIFVLDVERYFRDNEILNRTFPVDHKVIVLLFNMVKFTNDTKNSIDRIIDLAFLAQFTTANTEYKMQTKFINRQNLCYGVIINDSYIPCDYSVYIPDGVPLSFEALDRTKYKLLFTNTMQIIEKINNYITTDFAVSHEQKLYTYQLLKFNNYVAITSNKIIGASATGLVFYFNDQPSTQSIPIKLIKYDYTEINALVINNVKPVADQRTKKIGESLYNNYLYQLFIIEFMNYLNNERNDTIRNTIIELIKITNFKKNSDLFQLELKKILADYPSDYTIIQGQLIAFFNIHFNKTDLCNEIIDQLYDFDRVTLSRIKKLPIDALKIEIKKIADLITIRRDFDTSNIKFPNIYLPCAEGILGSKTTDQSDSMRALQSKNNAEYCSNSKLIINRDIDEFIDIFAHDLTDDLKSKYLLSNLVLDNIIDFLSFTKYPSEIITIYRLNE